MTAGALVTGGAGFIGSHLAEELVLRYGRVRVADDFSTGRRENLAEAADRVELVEGDLSDMAVAHRACAGVEVVYHLAARVSVAESMERPDATVRANVCAAANVLSAARAAGARRVVLASSCAVYGGVGPFPQAEDAPPGPRSPYAASKLCGEVLCRTFAQAFGLDTVSLRLFNVYGPRQPAAGRYAGVFPSFITRTLGGDRPVVFGDGKQTRDLVHVTDAARAFVAAGERAGPLEGAVVNVGSGSPTSVLGILEALGRVTGGPLEPVFEDERPGDVRDSLADTARAERLLGFRARVGFEEGLASTVEHFRAAASRDE